MLDSIWRAIATARSLRCGCLQLTEEAESHSLGVLSCDTCRQQRLALATVTVLSAHLADWLRRSWCLANDSGRNDAGTNTRHATTPPSDQPRKFSLGSYDLDADEADVLGHELMTLRPGLSRGCAPTPMFSGCPRGFSSSFSLEFWAILLKTGANAC
ncbi:hypothetical protein MPH_07536 [Macrophomina phaseolina MS6]|uniref:Uncharacterized protein n=1 Tax=Macrophomina phaseolina (strain MS6) TaxID=1126212 RepID=K2RYI8_MACPH|nr:hypothetical protein MPH_07536 [Macrophomina phaseolina MS6]